MQKNSKIYTNTFFVVIIALLCTALWGSATPFIKTGYQALEVSGTPSIMLFAGVRFALAGLITIIIYSIIERKFLFPKRKSFKYIGLISIFQTILQSNKEPGLQGLTL